MEESSESDPVLLCDKDQINVSNCVKNSDCEEISEDTNGCNSVELDGECWDDVKKEEDNCRITPRGKAVPSLDAISIHEDAIALSVTSLVGRYWNGMILLSKRSSSSDSKTINVEYSCTVPAGVSDLQIFGDSNVFTGHDDGCVSLLSPDESDTRESTPRRLKITNYALEHDSFIIRVSINASNDRGASLENDGRVKIWLFDPFMSVCTFKAFPFLAFDMAFHPKHKNILAICGDIHASVGDKSGGSCHNSLSLWNIEEGTTGTTAKFKEGVKCSESSSAFTAISWSPVDDDWLFAGDRVGNIYLFDIQKLNEPVLTIQSMHTFGAVARIVSDGSYVYSLGNDRRLAIREIYPDDDGIARERIAFGGGFRHSSTPRGLSVDANLGVWTCENNCQLWCHQLPVAGATKKIQSTQCNVIPELKSVDF